MTWNRFANVSRKELEQKITDKVIPLFDEAPAKAAA